MKYGRFKPLPSDCRAPVRWKSTPAASVVIFALMLFQGSIYSWAQQNDQQQMRGLDEQVQEIKSDVLSIAAELNQLEEKLLYPSGTQVAIFVALAESDQMRLDAVRLQIDGQLVAHYIYSAKELEALRKGGVQRIYVGNVTAGDHRLDVLVDGKLMSGKDFNSTESFTFRKEVKPKLVELKLAGPVSGNIPIALKEW
jgi:archaellum component FlaF (FlaF/FlaG flagellin family)